MKQVFEIDENQILKWAAIGFVKDNPHLEFDVKEDDDFIVSAWNDWGTRRYKITANVSYKPQSKDKPVQAKGAKAPDINTMLADLKKLEEKFKK